MKDFGLKKLYYSISEVSKLTGLEQYILRYWESEFEQLKPSKNRAGNRIYTNKDIQLILKIKELLREKKYTIEGAKQIIEDSINKEDIPSISQAAKAIHTAIKSEKVEKPKQNEELAIKKIKEFHSKPKEVTSLKEDLSEIRKFLLDLYNIL
jgi:DNA-binding transcriptional MerR regulator